MTETAFRATVLLFDGVEELDAFGPWETLRMWQHVTERDVQIRTASLDGQPVTCSLGLRVTPDGAVDDGPAPDLIIQPGGHGVEWLREHQPHLDRMRRLSSEGTLVTSVCNGALVLAAAGLLDGLPATSHWAVLDDLTARHPGVEVRAGQRWVDAGHVITSAGVTAGIDMALHVVDRVEGRDMATYVARVLEVPWSPTPEVTSSTIQGRP